MRRWARAPLGRHEEGRPLPSAVRGRARQTFGGDFDDVRVSHGRPPGGAGTLGAAHGRRIVLDASLAGAPTWLSEAVLAHELAHVAQQARAAEAAPPSSREAVHLEANADAGAWSFLRGERASVAPAPLSLSRCARPAGGLITPAHFRFRTTVPIRGGDTDPAGWQAAQIRATMSKDVGGAPYGRITCHFEVGVPLRNHLGPVSTELAQVESAAAANAAAYAVLSSGAPVTGADCVLFRRSMQEALEIVIPGARVSAPISKGLPVTDFP